ncbi:MAG: PIG-L family deacetylase [Bacteroidia bacterium]|nr:PIG-L family deacetylase [Bacteroidia bacterium]
MKVIVISAHPDDEVLGCGGTLLKHKANGDDIIWLIVTNVFESHGFSKERVASRQEEIKKVADMFGFSSVHQLNYPTMSLDSTSLNTLIPKISEVFMEVKPEVSTKSFRYPFIKKVLMYECLSETEFAPALPEKVFLPNYYVDITNHFNKKIEITKVYASELGEHPFPRSLKNIEALATYRGASVGVNYAEAFQLIKFIDK